VLIQREVTASSAIDCSMLSGEDCTPVLKPGMRTRGNMRTEKISCQKESKLLTTKMSILGCSVTYYIVSAPANA
jgi:hypothetical protein